MKKNYQHLISLVLLGLGSMGIHEAFSFEIASDGMDNGNGKSKELIDRLYTDISGFAIDGNESSDIIKQGGAPTYGEITYDSLKALLDDLKLTHEDVFYDLGSGVGKVVIQVFLDTPVKKSVGIELSPTRYGHAQGIKNHLKNQNLIANGRSLEFHNKDIAQAPIDDATVAYLCSTCFSDDLMKKLTDKFGQLQKGARVITLKPLPEHAKLALVKTYHLPMTWASGVSVYVYEVQD